MAYLKKQGGKLIIYCFLYGIMTLIFLKALLDVGIKEAMNKAGYSYITVENIFSFLSRPFTWLMILVLLLIIGIFLLYGISMIMTSLSYLKQKNKVNFFKVFMVALKRMLFTIRPKNILILFLAVCMFLTMNITLMIGIGTRTRLPRYFIDSISKMPHLKYFFIAVVMILLFISYINLFTLPYCLLEGKGLAEASKKSFLLLKEKKFISIVRILISNIGIALVSVIIYFLVILFSALFVNLFVQKTLVVAVFLSMYEHINFYVGCFVGLMGTIVNISLIMNMYFTYQGDWKEKDLYNRKLIWDDTQKKYSKKVILCLMVLLIVTDAYYTYDFIRNGNLVLGKNLKYIQITSHRGDSYSAPENTMPAIEKAIEHMADYVEIDVQETKDGRVVLMHDVNLLRTTGFNGYVRNLEYEQLRELDAGEWYSQEFKGTTIPALKEVFELCKGKMNINIELKVNSDTLDLPQKVVELIEQYHFERQCVITSASYEDLKEIKRLNPDLKTGYILSVAYGPFYYKEDIDFFSLKSDFVTDQLIKRIHRVGKEIHVWTVNSRKEIERMKQLGVDSIITDRPIRAREIIYKEESNKSLLELLKMIQI